MTRNRTVIVGAIALLSIAILFSTGCGGDDSQSVYATHTPKYFVALDYSSGNDVEVMSVDATTGALTSVANSPFSSLGLNDPNALTTHPNGQWIYACDRSNNSTPFVVGFTLSSAGVPSAINSVDTSDSVGCDNPSALDITPDGKYLYTAGNLTTTVNGFSIDQSTGGLTSAGNLNISSSTFLGAIAATDRYVYAAGVDKNIYISAIQSTGSPSSSTTTVSVGDHIYSLAIDATQRYLLAGGDGTGKLYVYSIANNGNLTLKSTTTLKFLGTSTYHGRLHRIVFSVDQKFVYAVDYYNGLHALSFSGGALNELSDSPYSISNTQRYYFNVQVDPSNQFVYAVGNGKGVYCWSRDTSTGVLTGIGQVASVSWGANAITLTF